MSKVLSVERLYSGRLLSLYRKSILQNDGIAWDREVVSYGGSAAVVVGEYDDKIVLVSQFRPTCECELLELPAGRIKAGETPEQCAVREFEEEVGLIPLNLIKLSEFYPSPGFVDEKMFLFFANEFRKGKTNFDPGEELKTIFLPADKVEEYLFEKIHDAKTLIGVLMWGMIKDATKR